jgi:hypothetical protein
VDDKDGPAPKTVASHESDGAGDNADAVQFTQDPQLPPPMQVSAVFGVHTSRPV